MTPSRASRASRILRIDRCGLQWWCPTGVRGPGGAIGIRTSTN